MKYTNFHRGGPLAPVVCSKFGRHVLMFVDISLRFIARDFRVDFFNARTIARFCNQFTHGQKTIGIVTFSYTKSFRLVDTGRHCNSRPVTLISSKRIVLATLKLHAISLVLDLTFFKVGLYSLGCSEFFFIRIYVSGNGILLGKK